MFLLYVPICSNMFQYVPICSNIFQYVPICSNVELDRVGLALRSLRNFTILYSLAECGTFCGALASCLHHCWRPQDQRLLLLTSQQQPSESRCQAAWALVQNVQKSSKTLSAFDATNVVRTSGVGMLYLKEYVEYGSQNQSAFFCLRVAVDKTLPSFSSRLIQRHLPRVHVHRISIYHYIPIMSYNQPTDMAYFIRVPR